MKPVKNTALDREENVSLMEPMRIAEGSPHRAELTDLALELARRSEGFRRSLPPSIVSSLATLVRAMNCYYSNLIEGHDTHPVDIELALKGDYSTDTKERDLQLEAKAHITVQEWMDGGALGSRATESDAIRETHRRFCEQLPEELLWVEEPKTGKKIKVIPLDGRGTLSEESLVAFTRFFLTVCLDQVRFMEDLMQPDLLQTRIQLWAEEQIRLGMVPEKANVVLDAILYRGELPRADVAKIVGTGERQARRVVSALVERGVLISSSSRAPLRLAFPAGLASRWMPGLFPEKRE